MNLNKSNRNWGFEAGLAGLEVIFYLSLFFVLWGRIGFDSDSSCRVQACRAM